jgi:hypothetical protein
MLLANQVLIEIYFDGILDKDDEAQAEADAAAAGDGPSPLAEDQKRIAAEIVDTVTAGKRFCLAEQAMKRAPATPEHSSQMRMSPRHAASSAAWAAKTTNPSRGGLEVNKMAGAAT